MDERPRHEQERLVQEFCSDFYIDADDVRAAIQSERLFNLMHLTTSIKVDLIVRKSAPYRALEFQRRQPVKFGHVDTWIVCREDLILSKLIWSAESASELQRRDIMRLLAGPVDAQYLHDWAERLGVRNQLDSIAT
jgi:hypothetical protein